MSARIISTEVTPGPRDSVWLKATLKAVYADADGQEQVAEGSVDLDRAVSEKAEKYAEMLVRMRFHKVLGLSFPQPDWEVIDLERDTVKNVVAAWRVAA